MRYDDITATCEDKRSAPGATGNSGPSDAEAWGSGYKVWIDLENSPHVPFFLPIIRELKRHGCEVVLTARDCFQVCELADLAGLDYLTVGRHYGKKPLAKLAGLAIRVTNLVPFALRQRPNLGVSHGSRSLIVLSALLGIRSITLTDYEHADLRITKWVGSRRKKWIMTPQVIPPDIFLRNRIRPDHMLHYPGIKEDVYVPFFQADPALRKKIGVGQNQVLVTLRPPATEAHYHNPESEKLLNEVLRRLEQDAETTTILLPRTPRQGDEIRTLAPRLFAEGRMIIPEHAIDGLDLIWHSDVVVSGGGTMNREAAALGVPVYSLFRGKLGAVDKDLAKRGKLILLQSAQDVRDKLRLARKKNPDVGSGQTASLHAIIQQIRAVLENRG